MISSHLFFCLHVLPSLSSISFLRMQRLSMTILFVFLFLTLDPFFLRGSLLLRHWGIQSVSWECSKQERLTGQLVTENFHPISQSDAKCFQIPSLISFGYSSWNSLDNEWGRSGGPVTQSVTSQAWTEPAIASCCCHLGGKTAHLL